MTNIPFLYVNIIALCAYALMFFMFLAAKKTPEILAFLGLMIVFVLWTAGSIFMRLQLWPSMNFWYYISLLAIFSTEVAFYIFLHCFARSRGRFLLIIFVIAQVALIPGTISGYFLAPPSAITQMDGTTVYTYAINWHMIFPLILFAAVIAASMMLLNQMRKERGSHSSGVWLLFWGGIVILTGNLMQIAIPGNTFPFDTLSGVVFAGMITFALYRRRLFRMTLVVSRGLLLLAVAVVCALMGGFLIDPLQQFFTSRVGVSSNTAIMLISIAVAGLLVLTYALVSRLIDTLFTREEQQNKLIKVFSTEVSQSLSTDDIMQKLGGVISKELPVAQVYICLAEDRGYVAKYSLNPLASASFTIDKDSPKIHYLREREPYLITSEFSGTTHAMSDWAEEKRLFHDLEIDCVAAMKDGKEIVGLILLSVRDRNRNFNAVELGFLETVSSIGSIAVKNAGLYEKMFREARVDSLTDVYNYRYFIEKLDEEFEACKKSCLTLMYFDVDDFKLYNQLYGVEEGDRALRRICTAITLCVGGMGTVFRTSGKVFAVLLPEQDARQSYTLAQEICRRISEINSVPERRQFKAVSVSVGICCAPHAASSAKELMDNADLAAFNAKKSGKNRITVFRGNIQMLPQKLAERTDAIVDRIERGEGDYRNALSMISAMTAAIDAKDHYTYAHSKNVARYAANLATAAGLNDEQVRTIYAAGLLHDIGKISIPENILNKTGKLDDAEYRIMQDHVNNSIEMIRHLPGMDYLIPAALGHHERWDGKGYPRRLSGENIPISARCLAIADVFDAMTTNRPYRKGLSVEFAVGEIERGAGGQFDPRLAAIFIDLVRGSDISVAAAEKDA